MRGAEPTTAPGFSPGTTPQDKVKDKQRKDSKSSTFATVYESGGGEHLLEVGLAPQNFQAEDGTWKKIDSTLVKDKDGYRTAAGPIELFFPDSLGPITPVRVAFPEGSLSTYPEGVSEKAKPEVKDNQLTYEDVLPDTDLLYAAKPSGYIEEIILRANPTADRFTWTIAADGLTLRLEESGEVSILSGDEVIGVMPAPFVYDSKIDPETGFGTVAEGFRFELESTGTSTYRLSILYDRAWLDGAAYPVTIDPSPISKTFHAWHDTYVRSCNANTNYATAQQLWAGYDGCTNFSYVDFDVELWRVNKRITYQAELALYKTYRAADAGSSPVKVHWLSEDWASGTVTYNNRPAVGAQWASMNGPASQFTIWDVGDLYQEILSRDRQDHGLHLESAKLHRFAAQEHTLANSEGLLQVAYNDLPVAPTPDLPADHAFVVSESPTLSVTGLPSDINGDKVYIKFQVSKNDAPDFEDGIVASSDWIRSTEWSVDAGALKDGGQYYWRAISWDVCGQTANGDDAFCSRTDAKGEVHDWNGSRPNKLTVSLPKYGSDDRWAMWSRGLGNGMALKVNQATGNLFLDYPLDALQTPLGPLGLSVSYNEQLDEDRGLGAGWTVGAGPLSDGTKIPVSLKRLPKDKGDSVEIVFADGDHAQIPHESGSVFRSVGGGQGVVTRAPNAPPGGIEWTYVTPNGSRYLFDTDERLAKAYPSTDQYPFTGYSYTFNSAALPRITSITDPLGRRVDFKPLSGNITSIEPWDGRKWTLTYDTSGQRLISIKEPGTGSPIIGLAYDASDRLSTITDGEGHATTITYYDGAPNADPALAIPDRAKLIKGPQAQDGTKFTYTGKQTGSVVLFTAVTDPRGEATSTANDHTTWTDFDKGGLPIRIRGPYDKQGQLPITTMVWNTNGNLICARSPAANRMGGEKCVQTGDLMPAELADELNTDYEYQAKAPYKLIKLTSPAPAPGETRAVTEYAFDEGFTGLHLDRFANTTLSGQPASASIFQQVNSDWGSGSPAGLPANNWGLRFTGTITGPNSGDYYFRVTADDGVRLLVGNSMPLDCWESNGQQVNCGNGPRTARKWMQANRATPITVEYYDATGPANLKLEWDVPGDGSDAWAVVPASAFAPNLNLVTSVEDAKDIETTYAFPDVGDRLTGLAEQVTRAGRTTSYLYDSYGRITTDTRVMGGFGPNQVLTTNYSDAGGVSCLASKIDRTGARTDYTCNTTGDITRVEMIVDAVPETGQAAQTRVIDNVYDPLGRVTAVSQPHAPGDPAGSIKWTYNAYDKAGRLLSVTDPMGNVTDIVHTHTANGRTTKEILPDPDGAGPLPRSEVLHTFDAVGNEIQTKDARGFVWTTGYDALNRVVSRADPMPQSNVTTTVHDLGTVANPVLRTIVTDPAGVVMTTMLDVLGRSVSSALGNFDPTTYEYDVLGNVTKATDPAGVYTRNEYNPFNQVTKAFRKTANNGTAEAFTEHAYDPAGNLDWAIDPRGHKTDYAYDAEGRITQAMLPIDTATGVSHGVTNFFYDDAGQRVRVVDGEGVERQLVYDIRGRVARYQDPRLTTTNTYDDNNRLTRSVDNPGTTRNFEYDNLGRLLSRYGASTAVDLESTTYDPAGNLLSATSGSYVTTLAYDQAGRVSQVTQAAPAQADQVTTYAYTKSQLTERTDLAGTTAFTYRPQDGLLATIADPFGGTVTYGYDAASGRLQSRTDQALRTSFSFDGAGRLYRQELRKATDLPTVSPFGSFELSFDEASNVTEKQVSLPGVGNANNSWDYTYDEAARLETAKDGANVLTTYGYDGASNRESVKVGTGPAVTTTYDNAGFPASASDGTTYDVAANGNLLGISGPRNVEYTYDTWNHMTTAQVGTGPQINYLYDALGRTMSRTASGAANLYGYVGTSEELAWSSDPSVATTFAHTPGGPLAQRQGSTTRYLVRDLHGDVVGLADTAGAMVGAASFGPWGEERASGGDSSVVGFQGDPTDPDTGLVDMTTRNYDPVTGRFNTRDVLFGQPGRPTSLNQFVYGELNPMTHADPTGMGIECPGSAGGGNWANCGPTGTESVPASAVPPHSADQTDDIFLHGPGYTDVALPIWTTPDAALVTYKPRLILPIRQALMAADPADVSSILKGLVSQAGSRTVLVTGWVPRTGRVGPGDSSNDCVGLAGCFTVSTTSFQPPKPATAPAPKEGGGCGFLGLSCVGRAIGKAAGALSGVAKAANVVASGVALAAFGAVAVFTAPAWLTGLAFAAAAVATGAAIVSTVGTCYEEGVTTRACAVSGAGSAINLISGGLLGWAGSLGRVVMSAASFDSSVITYDE